MTEAEIDAFFRAQVKSTTRPYLLTQDEHQRILSLWLEGLPMKRIVVASGRSGPTVRRIIRAYAGDGATRTKSVRNDRLAEMWNSGVAVDAICLALSMTKPAVHSIVHVLRKRGVEMASRR